MSEIINLALCDDMRPFCRYLERRLSREPDINVAGVEHSAKGCFEMVKRVKPHILLLDVQMETYDAGTEIIPSLKEASPDTKIIMLTVHNKDDQIFKAFTYGAIDYLTKTATDEEIIEMVRNAYHNTTSLSPEIAQAIVNESTRIKNQNASLLYIINIVKNLTTSEYKILKDLCKGLSYKQIAEKRFVEEITIRSQVSRVTKKFEVANINEIVEIMDELRFFDHVKL